MTAKTQKRSRKMSERRRTVADLRRKGADPLVVMTTDRRLRLGEHRAAIERLEEELRVFECFGALRRTWARKSCRHKIRVVLSHGVAMSPVELARLLGEKRNTVRSNLIRMRGLGEVRLAGYGRWIRSEARDRPEEISRDPPIGVATTKEARGAIPSTGGSAGNKRSAAGVVLS